MGIKHVAEFEFPREFGFHGSATPSTKSAHESKPTRERGHKGPHHASHDGSEHHMGHMYADGGEVKHPHGHHIVHSEHHEDGSTHHHHAHGGVSVEHADGHMTHHHHDGSPVQHHAEGGSHHMHPHGHHVVDVQHHADGRVVHHHAHGGHSVHHKDGRITHHNSDGSPAAEHHMSHGGSESYHDSSEYAHRHMAKGGDVAQDKAMIKKAFKQHDEDLHGGKHEELHLARGGHAGMKAAMPINRAPMNPENTPTPRNMYPAGQMGYGVEPSSESNKAPPRMARGGSHRGEKC